MANHYFGGRVISKKYSCTTNIDGKNNIRGTMGKIE